METIIYAGTYTAKTSKGIYSFHFCDGKLSDVKLFAEIDNPKYLAYHNGMIATVADFVNGSGVALFSQEGEIVDQIAYEERTSCHITCEGDDIYTANYHTGTVTQLKDINGKLKRVHNVQIQDGAGSHQVIVWKDRILVPCLFLDRVVIMDRDLNRIGSIRFNTGTGPRHGVISKDGEYLYLVSELSNELFVIHTGDWKIEASIPVLPNDEMHVRDTAAIRLSEDERYIYVSTRTKNVISVIELKDHKPELIQCVSTLGRHPRDFMIVDKWLLVANRNSNEIISFEIDEDGTLGKPVSRIAVPEAVSLI